MFIKYEQRVVNNLRHFEFLAVPEKVLILTNSMAHETRRSINKDSLLIHILS